MSKRRKFTTCFWCSTWMPRYGRDITDDHLLPKWFRRLIRECPAVPPGALGDWMGTVIACHGCNQAKGAMPPAAFARYRLSHPVLKMEISRWHDIARRAAILCPTLDIVETCKEMLEPFEHRGRIYPTQLAIDHARAQEAWHKRYDPAGPQPRSWEELMDPDAPRFAGGK